MSPDDSLPSLKTLERLLRETTETIAHECAQPSGSAPHWSASHWRVAQAVAAMHGVSPLLSQRLRWHGPWAWQQFLKQQWQQTFLRHQRISRLLVDIDTQARLTGIAILALKGTELHALGLYEPGQRPMADVDLLVHEQDVVAAAALLESMGHAEYGLSRRHRVFQAQSSRADLAPGENAERAIKLELHTRIAESLPIRQASITALLLPPRQIAGVQRYATTGALMTHLLLHAAGNIRARSLRLLQLHDIAVLSATLGGADWEGVLVEAAACWWAYPPLALTARYYPSAIPSAVLLRAERCCPRGLRRVAQTQCLSEVSLSHLWIDFCPGIEWSGSLYEKLRFMRARMFPDASLRAEVQSCEATEAWASNSAWTRLSRARRVLRWLVARTPRVATLWSVRQAWNHAPGAICQP